MQSAHACAVQTHFFVFTLHWPKAPKKEPKSFPKWSLWAHKLTKKIENHTLKKTLKKYAKSIKKGPQKGLLFRGGEVSKSQKSEP